VNGLLLIDKPPGPTSHDIVAAVRRSLGGVRTGHAGTLDPFASGLLLVLVGRATKAQRALLELPQRYQAVAQLGAVSTTGDTEGRITSPSGCSRFSRRLRYPTRRAPDRTASRPSAKAAPAFPH
jgi:tRNA pseudouridine55 synthase